LISELRLDPKDVFGKLDIIASQVNTMIKKLAPPGLKNEWAISFKKNSIAIGSARDGWAFTVEILVQKGLKPEDVFQDMESLYGERPDIYSFKSATDPLQQGQYSLVETNP